MTLIVDTGGLLSVLDANQNDHELYVYSVQNHQGPLVLSPLVLAELDHLILDRYGRKAEIIALKEVEEAYQLARFSNADLEKARALCSQYTQT